jgi:hypothetical protein
MFIDKCGWQKAEKVLKPSERHVLLQMRIETYGVPIIIIIILCFLTAK